MSGTKPAVLDMSDPLQVAVKVTSVEGTLALLSQQVSQGIGNMSTQLAALQGELRDQGRQIQTLVSAQHEIQSHSSGLERLAAAIERMTDENMRWRQTHEAENRAVSDSVTTAKGALKLIAWSGVFIVGLLVFAVQMQFTAAHGDRQRIERDFTLDMVRVDKRVDNLESKYEEIRKMKGLQ